MAFWKNYSMIICMKKNLRSSMIIIISIFILFSHNAAAQDKCNNFAEKQPGLFTFPVFFFQKFISGADGNRCPMSPSCSTYCINAFKKHGNMIGWVMTCDRLIRCGRDEITHSEAVWINGESRCRDHVEDNDFWWHNDHKNLSSK